MSTIDPGKLKVVELRAELASRGLDGKGNKAVLVQRLKEALEKESNTVLPNTSIVDTSTEDGNVTQESVNNVDTDELEKNEESLQEAPSLEIPHDEQKSVPTEKVSTKTPEKTEKGKCVPMETEVTTHQEIEESEPMEEDSKSVVVEESVEPIAATKDEESLQAVATSPEDKPKDEKPAVQDQPLKGEKSATESQPSKGEKRRRNSPSPQRVQRKRSRSPIREDEPELDSDKVLLSWYDSDLHLQIDKQSLLSAKPFTDGAFGYAFAGARTTHGVKVGKVCYEVKITEELKWEDIIKELDKRRAGQRADRRDKRRNDRRGRDSGKKVTETAKTEQKPASDNKEKLASENESAVPTETADMEANNEKVAENITEDGGIKEDKMDTIEKSVPEGATEEKSEAATIADKPETELSDKPQTESDAKPGEQLIDKPTDSDVKENGVKVDEKPEAMQVDVPAPVPVSKHVFRCGWSVTGTSLQLGETKYSYGFDSHGKFVCNNEFVDYGVPFAAGDVIGAYANIDEEKVELTYSINGTSHGVAIIIPRSELPEDFALFPHILSRNFAFELNLGTREEPWFPHPSDLSDFIYIQAAEDKIQGPTKPSSRGECEVVMMCGLPSSGKTHWVYEILKENPDKTYTILGTSHLLQKMTNNGKPLKDSYKNRWHIILDRLMKCVNTLVDKAAVRRRNFIIDQTNVFPSAQRRKMRLFEGFKRRAVIVVVSDEEQAKRSAQQEAQEGKDVPDSTLLEMKANMSLPKSGDWLEEIKYVELGEEEAKSIVQKYNTEGKAAGFGGFNRRGGFRDNHGSYRWNRNASRRDFRDNYRDGRSYQNSRFRSPGGYQERRSGPPGNWNRDYRDSRGPPRDVSSRNNRPGSGRHDRSNPRDRNSSGNYRNSRPQSNRNQASTWQGSGGGSWQGNHGWGGSQGGASYQGWGQGNWSGAGGSWKGTYGQGGYGQGGGYSNWNYGHYANNWPAHK